MSRPRSSGFGDAFDPIWMLATTRSRRSTTPESFWDRVDRSGGDGACWPWGGRVDTSGYGLVSWCGRDVGTHRLARALAHGPIDARQVVRHTCDNTRCCNPAHLILGSIQDNNADMVERGRVAVAHLVHRGASNFRAKLTDDLVRALRSAWRSGESAKSIASRTGLAIGTIHPMLHRRTWAHVDDVGQEAAE